MQKKILLGTVIAIIILVSLAIYFFKTVPLNTSAIGISTKVVTPTSKITNSRGSDYPSAITEQSGGFTEFSGTVVSVSNTDNDSSITLNVSDNNKVTNVKLLFPSNVKETLLYKTNSGVMENNQAWTITKIDSVLKEIPLNSQALIYIKKPKAEILDQMKKSGILQPVVGPIGKLAIYVK